MSTPQQRADILLAEHQQNRERNMSISYFDRAIKPHLQAAREYAYRTAREINRLPARPSFFTLAQDELDRAEQAAEELLQTIRDARRAYDAKPLERDHAA